MKLIDLSEEELTELYEMIRSYKNVNAFWESLQYELIDKTEEALNKRRSNETN